MPKLKNTEAQPKFTGSYKKRVLAMRRDVMFWYRNLNIFITVFSRFETIVTLHNMKFALGMTSQQRRQLSGSS